jgi:hypothetical protein
MMTSADMDIPNGGSVRVGLGRAGWLRRVARIVFFPDVGDA